MLSSHVSKVIKSRAVMLFAIVTGMSIDLGIVIYRSILTTLRGGSTDEFPHPHSFVGCVGTLELYGGPYKIFEQPKLVLDSNIIDRFKEWTGGFPDMRGVGYRREEDAVTTA